MSAPVPVTFFPSGITVLVPAGTTIAVAASRAGVTLSTPCGTRGICGECGVKVLFGELASPDATEAQTLKRAPAGVRLACRATAIVPVGVKPLIARSSSVRRTGAVPRDAEVVAGIDVGTTNVSAVLVDARSGMELAGATVTNRQERFGADVLTRMTAALDSAAAALAELAEESIAEALTLACEAAEVPTGDIVRAAVAANTAMASLLLGLDVSGLATHPFEPPFSSPQPLAPVTAVARAIPALVGAVVLPPIASFVGGDALAAALATGLTVAEAGGRVLVDVGTNAEVVLRSNGRLIVASAAAGPAFEGWAVSSGGRAGSGAVDRVVVTPGSTRLETRAGEAPDRFSGAGLVSALAVLRSLGWVDADGRIAVAEVPAERLETNGSGVVSVVLGGGGRTLALSQLDIRALQLAKAAIRTGVDHALRSAHLDASGVNDLLLAGAFGHALDPSEAAAIGLVPAELAARTRSVGNAALTGAAMVAVSPECLEPAIAAVAAAEHLDLASDPAFQHDLLAALRLAP